MRSHPLSGHQYRLSPRIVSRKPLLEILENRVVPANLRVVLVNDEIPQASQVLAAAEPGVITIAYQDATTSAELVGKLAEVVQQHQARIEQLGVVTHGRTGQVSIGADVWNGQSLTKDSPSWQTLRSLLGDDAELDLYACDVAAGAEGKAFVRALAKQIRATVRASDNVVGSGTCGDFTWEDTVGPVLGYHDLLSKDTLEGISGLALEDSYEPNNNKSQADVATGANSPHLGTLTTPLTISNLALAAGTEDWFRFETTGVGKASIPDFVRIEFANANGNLDMDLYFADGVTLVGRANADPVGYEQVGMAGLLSGTFYVRVYSRFANTGNTNYTLQIDPPSTTTEEAYEPNDGKADADRAVGTNSPNLGSLTSTRTINNLALNDSADWFRFQTTGVGITTSSVRIDFTPSDGNLDLDVYFADGVTLVGRANADVGSYEQIELAGTLSGVFYVRVYSRFGGYGSPSYNLEINPPATSSDTVCEPNDGKTDTDVATGTNSPNLGTLTTTKNVTGLVLNDTADWFRFQTAGVGTTANSVRIDFNPANGNLDMDVYYADGVTLVDRANADVGSYEQVSLAGLLKGTYYIRVYSRFGGYGGAGSTLR